MKLQLNDKVYDTLKWVALIVLPASATLYGTLASAWNWPCAEQIVYTITAIDTFLGTILGVSSMQYKADKEV